MKQKKTFLFVLGICFILASICLMLFFAIQTYLGTQKSQNIVSRMEALLPDRTPGVPGAYLNSGMPVLEIDGVDYVAMLEVPAFGLTLPVADQWDSKNMHLTPCRFSGSAYDNTLVIGGAESQGQFSFCDKIDNGAVITVTDMTGVRFTYTVFRVDRAKHAEIQWLLSADYDLTLFCRDAYSLDYIAVRCVSNLK